VKQANPSFKILEGHCAGPAVCPLNQVKAGTVVCVKHLAASPAVSDRLREMGLGEEQKVKLLSGNSNIICQVCNARVGLSEELAQTILVEPVPRPPHTR
jgi:ferrous iron transport protein A